MAFRIEGDSLTVKSHYAWVTWIFCGVFALGFPPAIMAMWKQGSDQIPLWFNLVFTGLFLGAWPFLLGEIAEARLITARINTKSGAIEIGRHGLFSRTRETRRIDDIARIEMQTSENDGYFFSLHVIFGDGTGFPFRHGNHREGMEEERDRFLEFIRSRRPEVDAVERFVAG